MVNGRALIELIQLLVCSLGMVTAGGDQGMVSAEPAQIESRGGSAPGGSCAEALPSPKEERDTPHCQNCILTFL